VFDVAAGGAIRHILRHPDTVIAIRWIARSIPLSSQTILGSCDVPALRRQWAGKLVAACADGNLYLWDCRDGRLLQRFTGHAGMVIDLYVAFTSSSLGAEVDTSSVRPIIVTAGDDAVSRVFEISSGTGAS
jgi:WD40 repeat protein